MTETSDDSLWVARCLRGDASAFEPLVRRYQRVLFNVALRMLGNDEDARDAVQNAFVRAYERLDTYDPARKFFSWMYRIAVNECLNAIRARRPTEELDASVQVEAGMFEAAATAEAHHRIEAALQQLTREYREVVVLRHYAEMSYEEIGAALRIPVKTVKSRLFTARQRLAEALIAAEGKLR
jgi:RNA polymerase sigma-70 factor (ECF subfamily)